MKGFDHKIDLILKPDGRQGKSKESAKGKLEVIDHDLEKIMEAENIHDEEVMEAALISFYEDRQKLKEKGVDESILKDYEEKLDDILETEKLRKDKRVVNSDKFDESYLKGVHENADDTLEDGELNQDKEVVMKGFDHKIDLILKPDGRQGKSKESAKGKLEVIDHDLEKIMEAENIHDEEVMEAALISFYEDRQKLKEKGVDESILKDYEEKLDDILETEKLRKDKRVVNSDKFDESYLKGVHEKADDTLEDGELNQDKEVVHSDADGLDYFEKDFDEKADEILENEELNQDRRVVRSDSFDYFEKDFHEETDRGKRVVFDEKVDAAKYIMDSIAFDIENIMHAKDTQDDEDMETALHSFYLKRKALKETGVDEDIMKGFDDKVDVILKTD